MTSIRTISPSDLEANLKILNNLIVLKTVITLAPVPAPIIYSSVISTVLITTSIPSNRLYSSCTQFLTPSPNSLRHISQPNITVKYLFTFTRNLLVEGVIPWLSKERASVLQKMRKKIKLVNNLWVTILWMDF